MKRLICIILFFALNVLTAQQKRALTDQEFVDLKAKIRLYFNANVDSSLVYAYKMEKSTNDKHLAFANGAMASLLQTKGDSKQSQEKYQKALYYLKKLPPSPEQIKVTADVYNYGGLREHAKGNFSHALQLFHEAIKLSEKINDINMIVKLKANITLINEAIGNHQLAIKNLKELDRFITKNENLFSKEDVLNRRSNINLGLGSAYEGEFAEKTNKWELLDSAEYYYKKTIHYSKTFAHNEAIAKLSLGNIFSWRDDYKNAEKMYFEVVSMTKKNNQINLLCTAYYDLGDIYRSSRQNQKALLYYQKSDSLSKNLDPFTYLMSNCYQARIYNELKQPELALKHSKIYLATLEKFQSKLREEAVEVNYKQGIDELTSEMVSIEKEHKKELFHNTCLKVLYSFLALFVIILLIKNIIDKKKAHKKMHELIAEFKAEIEKKNQSVSEINIQKNQDAKLKLSIKEIEENRIYQELIVLEQEKEYLNADFTLSYVAKKIKTNTTYLSHVVNKRFGKSFGEYSNELKINYVINELITNEAYRKYSTQATAESVGFKNASSFAKSFRKRTGVSPAQFANNIV